VAAFPPSHPDLFTPEAVSPPVPAEPAPGLPELEQLHPALWRAHQLGSVQGPVWPSGFAVLDTALPGGGWPGRCLSELLLAHPGIGEMRLLAPMLAAVQRSGRSVMLFEPPALPCGGALAGLGVDLQRLVVVHAARAEGVVPGVGAAPVRDARARAADLLWALEQALASGEAGAVLAWPMPGMRAESLRRLQLAAQAHRGPAFLLRELAAQRQPSAAPLRLALRPAGPDEITVQVVKRRGPPLVQPLTLALAPVLSMPVRARARRLAAEAAAATAPVGLAVRV